jgi:hypothetical protein
MRVTDKEEVTENTKHVLLIYGYTKRLKKTWPFTDIYMTLYIFWKRCYDLRFYSAELNLKNSKMWREADSKADIVHAMKAYRRSRGIIPLILNLWNWQSGQIHVPSSLTLEK